MVVKYALGAASLMAVAFLTPASAAPMSPMPQLGTESMVDQVRRGHRHRGFHRGHRHRHFGGHRHRNFGGHRFHRHRHGHRWHRHRHRHFGFYGVPFVYGGAYYGSCRYTRQRCAWRYGWHTGRYYRCVWRSGC
jgi:hypothetical protein